jgi:murein DD-endopeptidase MepM/ murein hydrolase activator NlpD
MIGLVVRLAVIAIAVFSGWALALVYPPPESLVERINPRLLEQRVLALRDRAVSAAASAGQLIVVERVSLEDMENMADIPDWAASMASAAAPAAAGSPGAGAPSPQQFETALSLCPGMTVSNAPRADASRAVASYAPVVDVNGVRLAVNPTRGACLSSGFGPRGARTHRGVDYHSDTGGPILAGADGTVLEMKYRDDYGNVVLIDHGAGVYTRYAHLSTFRNGLAVGSRVSAGELIGLMGNTAGYPLPIHLHYEVLRGDYANPRGSFGLEASDPFSYQAAR